MAYTKIQYIEYSGNTKAYFNTNYIPNSSTTVEVQFYSESTSSNAWRCIFGGRSSSSNGMSLYRRADNTNFGYFVGGYINDWVYPYSPNTMYTAICTLSALTINGVVTETYRTSFSSSSYPIWIFACNNDSSYDGRIYYLKISENGTVLHNYEPVRDDDNNVYFYDTVTDSYISPTNQIYFIAGADKGISVDPVEYNFNSLGGSSALTVTSQNSWTASTTSNWVTLSQMTGSGDAELTLSVTENTGQDRNVVITFVDSEDNAFDITVFQKHDTTNKNKKMYHNGSIIKTLYRNGERIYKRMSRRPSLIVSDTEIKMDKSGETKTITVTSDAKWTATTDADWLTITTGSGSFNVTASALSSGKREAIITVTADNDEVQTSKTISVKQATAGYEIDLNSEWRLSENIPNPDSSTYDGVYESFSNWNVHSSVARTKIIFEGYTNFSLYIRSYAESNYDYVIVSPLDGAMTDNYALADYQNTTYCYPDAHTRGRQSSDTSINGYRLIQFTNIPDGQHHIWVSYRKDSSANTGDDRGYLLIPKNQ